MGLRQDIKKKALGLSQKAMEKLFADERRAMRVAQAVGTVQRGKAAVNRGQDEVMRVLNLATRSDYKALGKQLSGLKRRLREVEQKLARLAGSGS